MSPVGAAAWAGWDGGLLVMLFCKPGVGVLQEGGLIPTCGAGCPSWTGAAGQDAPGSLTLLRAGIAGFSLNGKEQPQNWSGLSH